MHLLLSLGFRAYSSHKQLEHDHPHALNKGSQALIILNPCSTFLGFEFTARESHVETLSIQARLSSLQGAL